jgi:hypothetical protein
MEGYVTDMHRADRILAAVCPECFHGAHGECILQGCYCECQLPEPLELECEHGFVRSMCEQCEQEEQ